LLSKAFCFPCYGTSANDAEAYNNRGVAKSDLGDKQGAIADYNQAIRLNPDYADTYHNCSLIYQQLNDNENAIKDFLVPI
jgi:tetratricopeptide (TPR) repeat protein